MSGNEGDQILEAMCDDMDFCTCPVVDTTEKGEPVYDLDIELGR
jgi:hypothetical protein